MICAPPRLGTAIGGHLGTLPPQQIGRIGPLILASSAFRQDIGTAFADPRPTGLLHGQRPSSYSSTFDLLLALL